MSFAQDVKIEVTQKKTSRPCCALAAAYGVACFARYFDARGVVLHTELLCVAQHAKRVFALCDITGEIVEKKRASGFVYEFKVAEPQQVELMLQKFRITPEQVTLRINPALLQCPQCVNAFVSAAFLVCGTMTDPSKEYNLEFLSSRHNLAQDLEGLLAQYEFRPHRTMRKGVNVVYIKASGSVEDLLTFMGASNASMEMMNRKAYKQLRNKTNRLNNCETANMDKIAVATVQTARAVQFLKEQDAYDVLPDALKQAAQLRLDWPELSLAQLVEKSDQPISKSGLSHRLKKLERLVEEMQKRSKNG